MRRDPSALHVLRRSIAANPADGAAWSALGIASLRARNAVEARIHFAQATALLPGSTAAWHGLAWACLLLQDTPAALAAFRQALILDHRPAETHACVALALWLSGRRERALQQLAIADRLDPAHLAARYLRALQDGRPPELSQLRDLALLVLDGRGLFGNRAAGNAGA